MEMGTEIKQGWNTMKKTIATIAALMLCGLCSAQVSGQKFLRVNGRTIDLGESKYEVLSKIGEPDGKLQRERYILRKVGLDRIQATPVRQEKWLYNFGPRRFFHILTFENHELVCIEDGDYGYAQADPENCHVVSKRIHIGDITPVVLMKCGQPNNTETWTTTEFLRLDHIQGEQVSIRCEEWTYNYGPNQPLAILRFENGELVSVNRGPRGF